MLICRDKSHLSFVSPPLPSLLSIYSAQTLGELAYYGFCSPLLGPTYVRFHLQILNPFFTSDLSTTTTIIAKTFVHV